ncbi:transcription termination factor Rho [Corynebacterium sp.]|uniref:transcription termination factor Rho n=1 Tax=Corynebacterium sp. TaxID=1720 RepID=UPI00199F7C05|nr:transcription termination factor Rho [Corynebacterium sp.]HHU68404.1 transcription termination factor Rho [Corynebacterium sp.]
MTETDTATAASSTDLASLKLTELRKIAAEKGLKGVSGLRKGDLITAIQTGVVPARERAAAPTADKAEADQAQAAPAPAAEEAAPAEQAEPAEKAERPQRTRRATRTSRPSQEKAEEAAPAEKADKSEAAAEQPAQAEAAPAAEQEEKTGQAEESRDSGDSRDSDEEPRYESRSAARRARRNRARHGQREQDQQSGSEQQRGQRQDRQDRQDQDGQDRQDRQDSERDSGQQQGQQRNQRGQRQQDQDGEGRRGRRSRRNRRGRGGDQHDQQHDQQHDSADLQDVAGILDIVDNNVAFVRTTGYHASPADVFVQNQLIRRSGLRAGDAVTGKVRMGAAQTHGQGRNRQKYNQLVSVDTVNGLSIEEARNRPEFSKLTPLYPNQRLRLETDPKILTTRVIDLIMPIGKGQRALIVSPPKAGKTTIMQNIANAISTNNPECHLMVVLVDERPEEVTDMQRSVHGEVIASTFDRPPSEHTAVAELAIERAKRLVEQGKDVVVLLDSITRLGRAYNNSSPASGRILSGGVDSNALYPPKRFLGAARNIENGGSLTIIATAMVETGSAGDTVIFEEFKGTGNAELKLDRRISERRVFPAVDVNPSGTRKDELLLAPEEARIMHKLRRILSALDPQQAIDLLIKQLKKTKSNGEFLMQVASSAPMAADKDEEDYS